MVIKSLSAVTSIRYQLTADSERFTVLRITPTTCPNGLHPRRFEAEGRHGQLPLRVERCTDSIRLVMRCKLHLYSDGATQFVTDEIIFQLRQSRLLSSYAVCLYYDSFLARLPSASTSTPHNTRRGETA
jgi:hypothetical protein